MSAWSRYVLPLAGLLAACGPAGEPVPHFPGAYWHGASTAEAVACALSFAVPAIAQDTEWSEAEIATHLVPLEVEVSNSLCGSRDGCDQGEADPDTNTVYANDMLSSVAHEIRHIIAKRLTKNGEPTHLDVTGRPWSQNFEMVYRANLRATCNVVR